MGTEETPQREEHTMSAEPNYIDGVAVNIGLLVPDCPQDLLRLYALLALVKGTDVTLENVHDAWAVLICATAPGHPALIPFDELSPETQALDAKYADAIIKVASHREPPDEPPLPERRAIMGQPVSFGDDGYDDDDLGGLDDIDSGGPF